jgi:hypothetical protein
VITGLIILLGLFGWMDYLIFAKWIYPLDVDSTKRIPFLHRKVNQDCVLDWPLGEFDNLSSWDKARSMWLNGKVPCDKY